MNPDEPDCEIRINPVVLPESVLVATDRSPSLGLHRVMDRSGPFVMTASAEQAATRLREVL